MCHVSVSENIFDGELPTLDYCIVFNNNNNKINYFLKKLKFLLHHTEKKNKFTYHIFKEDWPSMLYFIPKFDACFMIAIYSLVIEMDKSKINFKIKSLESILFSINVYNNKGAFTPGRFQSYYDVTETVIKLK